MAGTTSLKWKTWGPTPVARPLLRIAEAQNRIVITIDKDFGVLIYLDRQPHAGLIRLPGAPPFRRIQLVEEIISRYSQELENRAIVAVRGEIMRISRPPAN